MGEVLLVTGGSNGVDIDTTEIYRPGSDTEWQVISSARLPRPMWGVRVTTLDSRVILFGGYDGDDNYDEILELAEGENWILVGKMKYKRSLVGLSLVPNFKDFESKCF